MFLSSFSMALIVLLIIIEPKPWYAPQYAIPLVGKLLGNAMNGVVLSLDHLTRSAKQQHTVIEARLMLGQSWNQAVCDIHKVSIRIGLIPIINAMAAAGIVSLPGMMTRQILPGTPPMEAVKYQILSMFLIGGVTGIGTIIASRFGPRRLF